MCLNKYLQTEIGPEQLLDLERLHVEPTFYSGFQLKYQITSREMFLAYNYWITNLKSSSAESGNSNSDTEMINIYI
jgi:hypothetical protein